MNIKNIIVTFLLICSVVYGQNSINTDSFKNTTKNTINSQDSNSDQNKVSLLLEKSEDNIKQTDRILNLMEIFVGFVAFVIGVLGIAGGFILQNIAKTRRRLELELNRLNKQWDKIRNEYTNLRLSFEKEMNEFKKILFFVTEGDNSTDSGRYDESISYYKQALKIKDDEPEVITKLCHAFLRAGKYDEAIYHYKEGINNCPDNINLLTGLGRVYRKKRNYERAKYYYNKALELDGNFIWALSGLGHIYL